MTYTIEYAPEGVDVRHDGYTMFDIEYYMTPWEGDKTKWMSEIHCSLLVKGVARFLERKLHDPDFSIEEFIKDAEALQDVRSSLWEHFDNSPKLIKYASHFHDREFGPKLKEIVNEFAEKYKLYVDID